MMIVMNERIYRDYVEGIFFNNLTVIDCSEKHKELKTI